MKKYRFVLGLASVLLTGVVLASPESSGNASEASFWDQFDTDKDGFISRQEAASMEGLAQLFDKIDSSEDDKLDKDELEAIHGVAHSHDHADGAGEGHPHGI